MNQSHHYQLIEQSIQYITTHFHEQPDLEELAAHVHLSKFHYHRIFQEWAGVSPKQFLQFITTGHAKRLLLAGRPTLETAHRVGLTGNGRLHDLFVKVEAFTPGEFKNRGSGLHIYHHILPSPFGDVFVAETKQGICQLSFTEPESQALELIRSDLPDAVFINVLHRYGKQLKAYFTNWQIPQQQMVLALRGTPFQLKVWAALLAIPTGELRSYNHIAQLISQPKASRAVGSAIAKNPVAFLIPCHRVIRESGEIGEYRWGHHRKSAIIGYEAAHCGKL